MAVTVKRWVDNPGSLNYLESGTSPRDANGKLVLATNPVRAAWGKGDGYLSSQPLSAYGDLYYFAQASFLVGKNFPGLYGRAYARFRSKAFEGAEAALAVDWAERRATLNMLQGTLSRLTRAALAVRRGHFLKAARLLGIRKPRSLKSVNSGFAENWLAYRYGWSPLYSSVFGFLEALDKPPRSHFIRTTVSEDRAISDSYIRGSITIKGQVVVSNPTMARLNQMGVLNPASVAWEITPFSFVADWFLPVGNYLANLTAFTGLDFNEFSITYHASGKRWLWYSNAIYDWVYDKARAPKKPYDTPSSYEYRLKERVTGSFPRPPLGGFINGFNPKRLLDTVSLLQTILLGKRK